MVLSFVIIFANKKKTLDTLLRNMNTGMRA